MTKTRVDLGNAALERLKKLVAGETADSVTARQSTTGLIRLSLI